MPPAISVYIAHVLSWTQLGPQEAGEEGHVLPVLGRPSVLRGGSHMLGATARCVAGCCGTWVPGTLLCVPAVAFTRNPCGSGSSV